MSKLKGTKTQQNLKDAFAGESQANRRYLYFAKVADVEGYPQIAGNFRETAEGETGHAHGHLDYLKAVGDPATDLPIVMLRRASPSAGVAPSPFATTQSNSTKPGAPAAQPHRKRIRARCYSRREVSAACVAEQ